MSVWAINTTINVSRQQQYVVGIFHGLAVAAIVVAYVPIMAKVAAVIVLGVCCCFFWRQLSLVLPSSIVALAVDDQHWTITQHNGQRLRVQLHVWAVWRYLIVLDFQAKDVNGRYRVILWSDSVKQADFRRLQVRLRLAGAERKLRLLVE